MDIVVTIPKSEYKNDDLETKFLEQNDAYQFWTLSKQPKDLKAGDRVYFVKNNRIESSMKAFAIAGDSIRFCEVTGRMWRGGCQIMLDDLRYEGYDFYIKGFQGFRYLHKILEKEGLL